MSLFVFFRLFLYFFRSLSKKGLVFTEDKLLIPKKFRRDFKTNYVKVTKEIKCKGKINYCLIKNIKRY